ncbi:MAG: DPP IV N-terminal domain-containing protein [Planctomycetaceae bacterium]|nr:DPP IV N-terminal domain-containing protein [Planctomycetaceae bacterium]
MFSALHHGFRVLPKAAIIVARVLALVVGLLATCRLGAVEPPPTPEDSYPRIYIGKPDGSEMKQLVELEEHKAQGSPTWSQDGKTIAFDAWRPLVGETHVNAKIVVVNADGTKPRILGDGAMPSFSPLKNRIAISRYAPNQGVWVIGGEGHEQELVLLDPEGWGTDWSPDGKQIVYGVYNNEAANLVVYDLIEGVRVSLFEEGKSPYSYFFWNFAWSPDGRRIAFKGQRTDGRIEIGIVDARGAKEGLVTRFEGEVTANVAWSHDSKQILFSRATPERMNRVQLFVMDADTKDPPKLLSGQDPQRVNMTAAFSPDGKTLLVASRQPPVKKGAKKGQ